MSAVAFGGESAAQKPLYENLCEGDVIAFQRVGEIIRKLDAESTEQSLCNLDYVTDWFYPGYYANSPSDPFEPIHVLLSNRRFAKVYVELAALDKDRRYALLLETFRYFQGQHKSIVDQFRLDRGEFHAAEFADLGRISEVEGAPRTRVGTMYALRAVVILAGMFGELRMWSEIKQGFENPTWGAALEEDEYVPKVIEAERGQRVFPVGICGETAFLMAANCDDASAEKSDFPRKAILEVTGSRAIRDVEILGYRSIVRQYDVQHTLGGLELDRSEGVYKVKLLLGSDEGKLDAVISAALK
jgi:hypothetical protein